MSPLDRHNSETIYMVFDSVKIKSLPLGAQIINLKLSAENEKPDVQVVQIGAGNTNRHSLVADPDSSHFQIETSCRV